VQGKGKTERTVFLSADACTALAEYLDRERAQDAGSGSVALFLSAAGIPARAADGRLSVRAINQLLAQIGRWHDAEYADPQRHISPLRPHDLRHTFAFHLAKETVPMRTSWSAAWATARNDTSSATPIPRRRLPLPL
jgi:site-specific recombinase XerD